MRVAFFGAYDPAYPRNRILREGLRRSGVEVIEARVEEHRAIRRFPTLLAAFMAHARAADVILVPEFRHKDVPLARLLSGSRKLMFDPLVSRYDTLVSDWGLHAEGSAQARWNRRLDGWALGTPDVVLCDTWAHGELFASLGAPKERLRRVLVGCEDAFFSVAPPPVAGPVRVLYVGGFLPLHGTLTIVEAVARLEREYARLPEFRVGMVGKGIDWEAARALAEQVGLERIDFPGGTDYADSPRVVSECHIMLGAFGTSAKAGRVIPHKVYQGLAAGRAVVTGDGPGVREVFEAERDLVLVPRGDPGALAEALARLIADPERRAQLGSAGRARALEVATPDQVGASLLEAMDGAGSRA
jgi:glycosyltransferase involved in cell wall biosynthesis